MKDNLNYIAQMLDSNREYLDRNTLRLPYVDSRPFFSEKIEPFNIAVERIEALIEINGLDKDVIRLRPDEFGLANIVEIATDKICVYDIFKDALTDYADYIQTRNEDDDETATEK